jgi:hypothetical protein
MDFPIKERDSIEARSGQRYSIDDKAVRQYLYEYTEDTFGDSLHIPASCTSLLSTAIDRNEGQANAISMTIITILYAWITRFVL